MRIMLLHLEIKVTASCDQNAFIKYCFMEKMTQSSLQKISVDFTVKITGNRLSIHFPLFLQASVNTFRSQAQYGSKGHYCSWSYSPSNLQRYF